MARARNIKPGFFANDTLAECSPLARLLFAGLWTIADRAGRLEDRPKRIKAALLPYDECDINDLLDQLVDRGFIARIDRISLVEKVLTDWAARKVSEASVLQRISRGNPAVMELAGIKQDEYGV